MFQTSCARMLMRSKVSTHVETVVCMSNKHSKPKDYVEIGVDAEDYYRIKDEMISRSVI